MLTKTAIEPVIPTQRLRPLEDLACTIVERAARLSAKVREPLRVQIAELMAGADGDDALDARKIGRFVAPLKMAEQSRDELVRWSDVSADLHVAVPQFAGSQRRFFAFRSGGDAHGLGDPMDALLLLESDRGPANACSGH